MIPQTLDQALHCHLDWLGRVVAAAEQRFCPADLLRETECVECAFGRWLRHAARTRAPELAELDRLHEEMHAAAARVLRLIEAGKDSYDAFEALSRLVVAFNTEVATMRQADLVD